MANLIELELAIETNIGPLTKILTFTRPAVLAHARAELETLGFVEIIEERHISTIVCEHAQDALVLVENFVKEFEDASNSDVAA